MGGDRDRDEPTGNPGVRRMRVVAALGVALGALAAGLTGVALVAVGWGTSHGEVTRPGPDAFVDAGLGASSDGYAVWARNDDGMPVRWDACSPIDVVYAPRGAAADVSQDLRDAVDLLQAATGLSIRLSGQTDEHATADRAPFQPDRYGSRWAPVLVAWATPGADDLPLRDTDRGVAIPIAAGPPGARAYVTAQVVLNGERRDLRAGAVDRADSWGATLTHELAHVLGLAHVDDPSQLMHVYPGEGPVALGAGDRAGLQAIGRASGCLEAPEPGPVEVRQPEG